MADPIKKIKGGLIRVTDQTVAETNRLVLEVSTEKVRNINQENVYVELDLTTQKQVDLYLPSIAQFNGALNLNIWVSDIQGTIDDAFNLTIYVAEGTDDTIGGQESIQITSKFSGMYITPLSSKQWGTFYTQNLSSKIANILPDDEVIAFKKLV